jgi:hypothetical protein
MQLPQAPHDRYCDEHGHQAQQPGVAVATAEIQVDRVVGGMDRVANEEPRQHHGHRVTPQHRQGQGDTDSDLERSHVVQEVGVLGKPDRFGERARPEKRPHAGDEREGGGQQRDTHHVPVGRRRRGRGSGRCLVLVNRGHRRVLPGGICSWSISYL